MASIPLGSAQIRLGNNFNQQFYYGDSNSAQLNMNNEMMRDYSVGGGAYGETNPNYITPDPIPMTSGAQRQMSMYRGGTGRYPDLDTRNLSVADNSQAYAYESGGGASSFHSWAKVTNPNMIGSGAADPTATNVIASYVNGSSSGNTAANLVADFGYLEPGNYNFAFEGAHYNTGVHYCIIRGYTGEHLSGSSSNYYVLTRNCYWQGGWDYSHLGTTGAGPFTVNSTYPYVIMSLETHLDDPYYLNTIVARKDSTSSNMNYKYFTNPNIWRVS